MAKTDRFLIRCITTFAVARRSLHETGKGTTLFIPVRKEQSRSVLLLFSVGSKGQLSTVDHNCFRILTERVWRHQIVKQFCPMINLIFK